MAFFGISPKYPKMAKNGVLGERGKNGVFGKMGYFAKIVIVVKNGDFCVFGENGEKWKSVILTDLVKNVKKGDFLTFYHIGEKGGNTVFPGISVLGKKVKLGVFVWKLIYRGGNLTEVDLFLEEFLEVEDYSEEKSEEWNQMRR